MNRFLEGCILGLMFITFAVVFVAIITFFMIVNNNMDQENECYKMQEYGYLSTLQEDKFILTCYIIMEEGVKIRSNDYVISDYRKPRMLTKYDAKTRVDE